VAEVTEDQLVARLRRGDRAALAELLERSQHRLFNVALRMLGQRDDAAEITQDAMLKIVAHIGAFRGDSAVATWMIRIVMNLSIAHLRKRRLRLTASLDAPGAAGRDGRDHSDQGSPLRAQLAGTREPGPEASVQQREMVARLHAAVRDLPEEFRAVLVLRDIEEMDYQQIALTLALPAGTVKSRLFRARLALRQKMLESEPAVSRIPENPAAPAARPGTES
jgi:RNA polymerase sigma-70 factor (ECF subfamily)